MSDLSRFFAKVQKDGPVPAFRPELGPCWVWTAAKNNHGHGVFWLNERLITAHSAGYILLVGPIPSGLEVDHLCRVRHCVNPDHLEAVTHQENMARGHFGIATHCPRGHAYDGENLYRDTRNERQCRSCRRDAMARFYERRPR